MKIKSVPAACAAFAVICATSVFASAETAPAELSANDLLAALNNDAIAAADESAKDIAASSEKNSDSGVEGVAAVVGAVALAGAAVVISRKKA